MVSADLRLLNDVGLGGHGNEEVSEVTLHGPMVKGGKDFRKCLSMEQKVVFVCIGDQNQDRGMRQRQWPDPGQQC